MEDFVPFELAKKLEGLGFDESSLFFYREDDEDKCVHCVDTNQPLIDAKITIAPTISQVLKWLFNKKQLFVNIDCNICDKFGLFFTIYKKGEETWEACGFDDNYYNKPEEASLAGIEYVLDNLI